MPRGSNHSTIKREEKESCKSLVPFAQPVQDGKTAPLFCLAVLHKTTNMECEGGHCCSDVKQAAEVVTEPSCRLCKRAVDANAIVVTLLLLLEGRRAFLNLTTGQH